MTAGVPSRPLPGNAVLLAWFVVTALAAAGVQIWLQATFRLAHHPVPLAQANLEADPAVVRGWYEQLLAQGTYLQFVRAELVDLLWPACLAGALVSLYRLIGGLLRVLDPPVARLLVRLAPFAAVGPAFDVVENGFSLAMLTDPTGFPDWWATAHVVASWCKLAGSVLAAVAGSTLTVVALAGRAGRVRKAADGGQALPPR
ncbi:hypothetical protein [Myceligenerans pegani]|uniref:Uncharacterized protein n=1 Tax=Myceligenerans pegani TaxID=2776917 RepID=A0ABR9N4R5_9MICO|nr:hypothetical protein [Myceligenerans sp. TRM 65318]MBE1878335.1 hypothetical protein [Myceligenerans sp. TRM 65318]MBE3020606.1 hypothetical protein [Myceligenerans sp. TRM 65318]